MSLRFGTDGVRGVANVELTPELVLALGRSAARVLPGNSVVIGLDTRVSGPLLQNALAAGFSSEGWDVDCVGVVPTPHVAWMSQQRGCAAAMISASHNPFADNGIKFFLPGGLKLSDEIESELENELDRLLTTSARLAIHGDQVGTIRRLPTGVGTHSAGFLDHLIGSVDGRDLLGMSIVLDCANGAASTTAPSVFVQLGASITVIHASPDGVNINDRCGSTYPEDLQREVVARIVADARSPSDDERQAILVAVGPTSRLIPNLPPNAGSALHRNAEFSAFRGVLHCE